MRITILLVICLITNSLIGQEYRTVRKVVPVLTEQSFYLNGGVRAAVGGKSRVYYEIQLPKNTIGWFYSFSTSINEQGRKNLNLFAQLTKVVDPSGLTAIATESLLPPSGVASADVYVCDRINIDLFARKLAFNYYLQGSREN